MTRLYIGSAGPLSPRGLPPDLLHTFEALIARLGARGEVDLLVTGSAWGRRGSSRSRRTSAWRSLKS